jgi:hypothetical protein
MRRGTVASAGARTAGAADRPAVRDAHRAGTTWSIARAACEDSKEPQGAAHGEERASVGARHVRQGVGAASRCDVAAQSAPGTNCFVKHWFEIE